MCSSTKCMIQGYGIFIICLPQEGIYFIDMRFGLYKLIYIYIYIQTINITPINQTKRIPVSDFVQYVVWGPIECKNPIILFIEAVITIIATQFVIFCSEANMFNNIQISWMRFKPETCRMPFRIQGGPTDNINIGFINYAISQARKLTRGCQMCHVDTSRTVKMYGRMAERKISATNFSLPSRRKNVKFNDDVMTRKWWQFGRKTHLPPTDCPHKFPVIIVISRW